MQLICLLMLQLPFDSSLYTLNVSLNGTLAADVLSIKAECVFAGWVGLMPELSHHLDFVLSHLSCLDVAPRSRLVVLLGSGLRGKVK